MLKPGHIHSLLHYNNGVTFPCHPTILQKHTTFRAPVCTQDLLPLLVLAATLTLLPKHRHPTPKTDTRFTAYLYPRFQTVSAFSVTQ